MGLVRCCDGCIVDTNGGTCSKILCSTNQGVKGNACVSCLAGTMNTDGGDDAPGADTTCDDIICAVNEYVYVNACKACPPGTPNVDGGDIAGEDDTAYDKTLCG